MKGQASKPGGQKDWNEELGQYLPNPELVSNGYFGSKIS